MIRLPIRTSDGERGAVLEWADGDVSIVSGDLLDQERVDAMRGLFATHQGIELANETDQDGDRIDVQGIETPEAFLFAAHFLPSIGFGLVWSGYENDEPEDADGHQ